MATQASLSHLGPGARENTQPPNILDSVHPPNVPGSLTRVLMTQAESQVAARGLSEGAHGG